jgi:uncharacterized protein YdaU (DUF1376 family)
MMRKIDVLPIETDALLADTIHMSTEAFGAYVRILLVMWRNGGRLNYDATRLAKIAVVTPRRWQQIEAEVLGPMTRTPSGSTGTVLSVL